MIALALIAAAAGVLAAIPHLPTRGHGGLALPFLSDTGPPVVVAFAGFPGCASICPPSLRAIGEAYDMLSEVERGRTATLFINLQIDSSPRRAALYAQAFHPALRAYSVDADTAPVLRQQLALHSYPDAGAAAAHAGRVYLFSRQDGAWRIAHVYARYPGPPELARRLRGLTRQLTTSKD